VTAKAGCGDDHTARRLLPHRRRPAPPRLQISGDFGDRRPATVWMQLPSGRPWPTDTSDAILAFDAESGELVWSRQTTTEDAYNLACVRTIRTNCPQANRPDYDFRSSAVLIVLPGGKRALIGAHKSSVVTAVDPDRRGEIIWQRKVGRGGRLGGVQWGVAADESKVYIAVSDVRFDVVAPSVPGAQISPVNPTIALLLDNKVGGGLHALNLETGDESWQTPHPGCNDVPGCKPRTVGRCYSNPRHRVLRRARRPSSRLRCRRRP
jgi:outer membrane protein assembly factor BamB